MSAEAILLPMSELTAVEAAVHHALTTGDESALDVLGYGEISCVVGWSHGQEAYACKRLPPFPSLAAFQAYRSCFEQYLLELQARGVRPLPSTLEVLDQGALGVVGWCVQPRLDAGALLSKHLHACGEARAVELFERVLDSITAAVDPTFGLDAQLSNWILVDAELRYLDVTTPMLRERDGSERLPLEVFMASLPWALRGVVRRFLLQGILDKYYVPRGVVLDVLGNLQKERLDALLPAFLARANERVAPAISAAEVRNYYADDARSWALLQRLRRIDRWWQRGVRRRTYPFLLPRDIRR